MQTQVSKLEQVPFPEQTVGEVELTPKQDVMEQVTPENPVLQEQLLGDEHAPFPEQTFTLLSRSP